MELAQIANIPRRIDIGGKAHLVSALTQYEWATFQAWIGEYVPRPEAPEGADSIERMIYRKAWPPSIASKEWFVALDHPGCFPTFVRVALGKHKPEFITDEESIFLAYQIASEGKVSDLVMRCLGGDPGELKGVIPSEPEEHTKLPEGDDPGDIYFQLAKTMNGWSHDNIMALTFPQIRYYRASGKPLDAGSRRFTSVAEARAARDGRKPKSDDARVPTSPPCSPSIADPPRRNPEPEVKIYGDFRG